MGLENCGQKFWRGTGNRSSLIPTTGYWFCLNYVRHYHTKAAISEGYCTFLHLSHMPCIPFHPFACAEGILFCKLVCPKLNQWFCKVSAGTGYSPACINASARDGADMSSWFCISSREHEKVHGPPSAVVQ